MLAKPSRDAAAKAKLEAEAQALSAMEVPIHADNEWNIRYASTLISNTISALVMLFQKTVVF